MLQSRTKVAFLGDSITAAGQWETFFPDLLCRNFGIDGDCSGDVLRRLTPVIEFRPDKLFLMIGTNDLGLGPDEAHIVANVARILDQVRAALPGCWIVLQSVLPRESVYAGQVQSLNRHYVELAQQRAGGVRFLDLFPLFDAGNGALRAALTSDGLHLISTGYEIWKKAISPYVHELNANP